jgi:aminoglycoside phosphotransferase (APT) family kinase protein
LHAAYWADPVLDGQEFLRRTDGDGLLLGALLGQLWPPFLAEYAGSLPPGGAELGRRFVSALPAWTAADTAPRCLAHGDYRVDNMMFGPDGITIVDWQTVQQSGAAADVAYFLGASLTPQLRRAHEDELVAGYHEALCATGVEHPLERFREEYRHATLAGVVMTVAASMLVTVDDRGRRMFATMAERHFTHALDAGVADLLG